MRRGRMSVIVAVALVTVAQWTWRAEEVPAARVMTVDAATYQLEATRVEPRRPCDDERFVVRPEMGGEKVGRRMAALIRCVIEEFGPVPGGVPNALRIARCESGDHLWPWAQTGSSAGVFQQNTRYWVGRVSDFLRAKWFTHREWRAIHSVPNGAYNPRANVIVSIRMAHGGGWGPWSCA